MKTVKVRAAVLVNDLGDFVVSGWCSEKHPTDQEMLEEASRFIADGATAYFIEAEVPLPQPETIKADVLPANYQDDHMAKVLRDG